MTTVVNLDTALAPRRIRLSADADAVCTRRVRGGGNAWVQDRRERFDPVDQAAKLRGLNLSIYTGDGRGKADLRSNLIERGAAAASTDTGAVVGHIGPAVADPAQFGHAGHGSVADLTAAMDAAGGWDSLLHPLTHASHLGPAMLGSHLLAVVATVVLIGAVSAGLVRAALRFVALLRTLVLPATPVRPTWTGDAVRRAIHAPHLDVRPQRGPPVHS